MPILNRQEDEILRRQYEFTLDVVREEGQGGGTGTACVMGVLDAYRSVWSPRAFSKAVLSTFEGSGFISDCHDWQRDLATINSAKVKDNRLTVDWDWYSIEAAQEMRTKCRERKDRNKFTGLSIGASVNWSKCADFDSGEKLWTYAEGLGENMSLYDPEIRKYKGYCWIIPEVKRLYEVAITLAPAVPGSQVTEARSIDLLQDSSLRTGLSLEDHLRLVLTANAGLEARLIEKEGLAESQGRRPYVERLDSIRNVRDSLTALIDRCGAQPETADMRTVEDFLVRRRIPSLRG